jgi:arylsulfatase A-like enzyme
MHPGRLVTAFAFLAVFAGIVSAAETRPNVIIILADDLGYGDLGCYGHPRFKTPNLDRMAKEGVRLIQFNTPAPFCAPTRASLLTGRYPFRCGMTANPAPDGDPGVNHIALPQSEILLPELLKRAGYATGMIGKWHLGHNLRESLPVNRGFDEYLGILYSNDMRPVQLVEGERPIEYPLVQATLTRRYTQRALEFVERNAAKQQFYKKSGAGLYGDVMADLDASVGEVLAKVKALGLDERTLVIFTSDNGPWYGGSSGGLRGMKGTSWEGGYRVPFIARWPGHVPAGKESAALGVMMDLFSTTLAVTGVAAPSDRVIDGRNLWPVLTTGATSPHEFVFGHQGAQLATIRDARWKLHALAPNDRREAATGGRWIDPRAPDGVTMLAPYEQFQPSDHPGAPGGVASRAGLLFDLQNDPSEQRDVSAEHPDIVARLQQAYDVMKREMPAVGAEAGAAKRAKKKQ